MIASDPDAPEAADEQLAQARAFTQAFPALTEALRKSAGVAIQASGGGAPEA